MAQNQTTEERIRLYRFDQFLSLGFDLEAAEVLADARGSDGFLVSYQAIRRILDQGCDHDTALRIYS